MKKILLVIMLGFLLALSGCNGKSNINNTNNNNQEEQKPEDQIPNEPDKPDSPEEPSEPDNPVQPGGENDNQDENGGTEEMQNPIIIITLEDDRQIKLELYPDVAPITVANFLKLVDEKFFDGVCFHRVIPGFMIQTGGYYLDGYTLNEKEEVPSIKGEFASNGVENDLLHKLGVISMARTGVKDSASSQFFICSADAPHLDGEYAAFGKTIDEASNQVVLEISAVPTMNIGYGFSDFPQFPVVIKTIRRGE